jgi:hypothetical protein
MFALSNIQLYLSTREAESLYDSAANEVIVQDLLQILLVDIGVPGSFGIDDRYRPFGAAIQTPGGIDAHPAGTCDSQLLRTSLQVVAQALGIVLSAALTAVVSTVGTKEYMVTIVGHGRHFSWQDTHKGYHCVRSEEPADRNRVSGDQ